MRGHGGEQLGQDVQCLVERGALDALVAARRLGDRVVKLHDRRDGGVVAPTIKVAGDARDGAVRRLANREVALVGRLVKAHVVKLAETIEALEEAPAALDHVIGLVGPVQVVPRRAGEEVIEPQSVGPDGLVVVLRGNEIALGLGHLRAPQANHALGEESLERLARAIPERARRRRGPFGRTARRAGAEIACSTAPDVLVDRHPLRGLGWVEGHGRA